ncbi:MAG: hypothetical protein M1308_03850 [Actinobacteria bacterium]|nr:hypothetical protein [Actinomycetota bacterium]
MKSRERVKASLNFEKIDRLPMDLGGGVSTLTYGAYLRLAEYIGLKKQKGEIGEFKVMETIDEEILNMLKIDFRHLFLKSPKGWQPKIFKDGTFADEWGIKFRDIGDYIEMIYHPLKDATINDLETFNWPDFSDSSRTEGLRDKAKWLYENTDFALATGSVGGRIFEQAQWLRGMQTFFEDLLINQDFAEALMDKLLQLQKQFFDLYLDAVGDYIEVICMGDDLATQNSLLLSPQTFRKMIKPKLSELYSHVKKKTKAKIMHHSCGSVFPLIDDLIEIGVDILNPVQPLAKDMNIENLKKKYGKNICFWGGIDEQKLLPFGNLQDITEEVGRLIKIFGRDGGYILAPAHNIQSDVKPENIIRLYEIAADYKY